jgi:hypothetical protein
MIDADLIEAVVEELRRVGLDAAAPAHLRKQWPDVHFTQCSEDDVGETEPVRRTREFDLHLVDGRDHCLRLTTELVCATGLLIAEREEP